MAYLKAENLYFDIFTVLIVYVDNQYNASLSGYGLLEAFIFPVLIVYMENQYIASLLSPN